MIHFKCRQCREGMEAPESLAGQTEKCPSCGRLNRVPRLDAPRKSARAADPDTSVPPADSPRRESRPMYSPDQLRPWSINEILCCQCGKYSPTPRTTFVCPFCGYTPRHPDAPHNLLVLAGEMTEVARAAVGSEPQAVRIQCRCSNCGAASEMPPAQAGRDEICPECGRKLTAADRLASELIAFSASATMSCQRCKTSSSVMQFGMTCPHCGYAPREELCEAALKERSQIMGDWREIKRLGELLGADSAIGKPPRFICPFCKFELPSPLAERNFAHVDCPRCNHRNLYVYNAEAFDSPRECQRILAFRLEKRKKANEKARRRELAEAAKEIGTETQPDRAHASGGHVYALLNSTMPGLVKVGKTERDPEERAKELSCGTGTPTPFVVAYAEWFKDCSAAEDYVHGLLEQKGFRVAQNREFFCAPVKAAIQAIMKAKEREDQSGGLPPQLAALK